MGGELETERGGHFHQNLQENILNIAINPNTDESLLLTTIDEINSDLTSQIKKVEQSNSFFSKYSNVHPVKRILGYLLLILNYFLVIALLIGLIWIIFYGFVSGTLTEKFLLVGIVIISVLTLNWWISK